jgi:hypothetical protein
MLKAIACSFPLKRISTISVVKALADAIKSENKVRALKTAARTLFPGALVYAEISRLHLQGKGRKGRKFHADGGCGKVQWNHPATAYRLHALFYMAGVRLTPVRRINEAS